MSFITPRQFGTPTYYCVECGTVYSVEAIHTCEDESAPDEDFCHCGAPMGGSDHCSICYCEQYERECSYRHTPRED